MDFSRLDTSNFRTDLPRPRYMSVEAWIAVNMASKKRLKYPSAQFYIVIIFRSPDSVISNVHIWVVYIEIHTQDSK